MLLVADGGKQLQYLLNTEYLRELMGLTGIKCGGDNKRRRMDMFEIKAAGLGYLVAFFTPYAMLFDNEADVADDILLGNRSRQQVVIVRKQKAHLLHIVADGTGGILFCHEGIVELLQASLRLGRKGYFAVLVFFYILNYF